MHIRHFNQFGQNILISEFPKPLQCVQLCSNAAPCSQYLQMSVAVQNLPDDLPMRGTGCALEQRLGKRQAYAFVNGKIV